MSLQFQIVRKVTLCLVSACVFLAQARETSIVEQSYEKLKFARDNLDQQAPSLARGQNLLNTQRISPQFENPARKTSSSQIIH